MSQIKIKCLYCIKYPLINIIKCHHFLYLTHLDSFRSFFGSNENKKICFWNSLTMCPNFKLPVRRPPDFAIVCKQWPHCAKYLPVWKGWWGVPAWSREHLCGHWAIGGVNQMIAYSRSAPILWIYVSSIG